MTIQHVLNDKVSVRDVYNIDPKTLDWIIGNASILLDKRQYEEADKLIDKVRAVEADHAGALYLYGMRQLQSKNISESKAALSRLLELTRSGNQTAVQPREEGSSALAMAIGLYIYSPLRRMVITMTFITFFRSCMLNTAKTGVS